MNVKKSRLTYYCAGIVTGLLAGPIIIVFLMFGAADWLVINDEPVDAEVVVVLSGGGGSRLKHALSLYDAGIVKELVLVGPSQRSWDHITENLCSECDLLNKKVTIINGSTSTETDAQLLLQYCQERKSGSIAVVTDPYHTRRAFLTFNHVFKGTQIKVFVISSGDYGDYLSPDDKWWQHSETLETVWMEFGKCLWCFVKGVFS